jgi:uncharacterized protein YdcH (DUF465 family)
MGPSESDKLNLTLEEELALIDSSSNISPSTKQQLKKAVTQNKSVQQQESKDLLGDGNIYNNYVELVNDLKGTDNIFSNIIKGFFKGEIQDQDESNTVLSDQEIENLKKKKSEIKPKTFEEFQEEFSTRQKNDPNLTEEVFVQSLLQEHEEQLLSNLDQVDTQFEEASKKEEQQTEQKKSESSTQTPKKKRGGSMSKQDIQNSKIDKQISIQKGLKNKLISLKSDQEQEIIRLENLLNRLLKPPREGSSEVLKQYDDYFKKYSQAYDDIVKKFQETNSYLADVDKKLQEVESLVKERDANLEDKEKSQKLQENLLKFEPTTIDLKPLEEYVSIPAMEQQQIINFTKTQNPNAPGYQLPRAAVEEKKQQLKTQEEKLKQSQDTEPDTKPTSSNQDIKTTPASTAETTSSPLIPQELNYISPNLLDSTTPNNEFTKSKFTLEETISEPSISVEDLSSPLDFNLQNKVNTSFDSFKIPFEPVSDLPNETTFSNSMELENEKLDNISQKNDEIIQILYAMVPLLGDNTNAASAITNMGQSQSPSPPIQIPIQEPGSNRNDNTPSFSDIAFMRPQLLDYAEKGVFN